MLKENVYQNQNNYSIIGKKITIKSKFPFTNRLPPEILLSFYKPFNNLYFIILCTNKEFPTYRCSTRFNKNINVFGCEINVTL